MLKQRIITAIVMLAILLPVVFYPSPLPFGVVALGLIAAGSWEWALLNQYGKNQALRVALLSALACGVFWYVGWTQAPNTTLLWIALVGLWVPGGAWLLRRGLTQWTSLWRWFRLSIGLVVLWGAWLAVMQAKAIGVNFLISCMALAWAADSCAYCFGRALGGRFFAMKLAPQISPGKTWEGFFGGMVGVCACAALWIGFDRNWPVDSLSLYSVLNKNGFFFVLLALLFLTAMSVVGDLVESLFKRCAGVKDSSGLLPGHGGVLDRLDAMLPTLPLAMLLVSLGSV